MATISPALQHNIKRALTKRLGHVVVTERDLTTLGASIGMSNRTAKAAMRMLTGFASKKVPGAFTIECIPSFIAIGGVPIPDWPDVRQNALQALGWDDVGAEDAEDAAAHDGAIDLDPDDPDDGGGAAAGRAVVAVVAAGPAPAPRRRGNNYTQHDGPTSRSTTKRQLRLALTAQKKRAARWQARYADLKRKHDAATRELMEIKAAGKLGKATRYFSPEGGLSMAIRRNQVNSPCAAMGLVVRSDTSRYTCARWELILDSSLRMSCREAYRECEEFITILGGFSCHSMMTDATNARIWHDSKVLVGEYCSTYYVKADPGEQNDDTFSFNYLGDLQLQTSGTAQAARRMMLNQTQSIGFPSWVKALAKHGAAPTTGPAGDIDLYDLEGRFREQLRLRPGAPLNIYCHSTDGGSDQRACRKDILRETMACLFVLVFEGDCLLHASHLAYRNNLKVSEFILATIFLCAVGYFSSLAKVVNTWRDKGRKVYAYCAELFGALSAKTLARRSPPRCLIGRWGSEFNTTGRILAFEPAQLVQVWETMQRDQRKRPRAPAAARAAPARDDPVPLDEHMQDEIEHQRSKNSRWYNESFAAIRAPAWWMTMRISYRVRKVFNDVQASMQKHAKTCPDAGWKSPGYIALLVWGKAAQHTQRFEALAKRSAWIDIIDRGGDDTIRRDTIEQAIAVTLINASAEYDSRIACRTRKLPERLLILGKARPDDCCRERQLVCQDVMALDKKSMEITTLKFCILFGNEIRQCAANGKLDAYVHRLVLTVCHMFRTNTQQIEGLNSVLKRMLNVSRGMGQRLASARLSIKHQLGAFGAGGSFTQTYSKCATQSENMLADAVSNMKFAEEINDVDHRWQEPGAATFPDADTPLPRRLPDPSRGDTPANLFGKDMNWFFFEFCCSGGDGPVKLGALPMTCICLGAQANTIGQHVWVTGTINLRLAHMMRATMIEPSVVRLDVPFIQMPSLALFSQFHATRPVPSIYAYTVTWTLPGEHLHGRLSGERRDTNMDDYFEATADLPRDDADPSGHDDDDAAPPPPRRRARRAAAPRHDPPRDPAHDPPHDPHDVPHDGPHDPPRDPPPLPPPHDDPPSIDVFDTIVGHDAEPESAPPWADGATTSALTEDELRRVRGADRTKTDTALATLAVVLAPDVLGGDAEADDLANDYVLGAYDDDLDDLVSCYQRVWMAEWTEAFEKGHKAWQYLHEEARKPRHEHMSLIQFQQPADEHPRVELVHWVGGSAGRVVQVKDGRLVALVPAKDPVIAFKNITIIVPDVGERGDRRRHKSIRVPAPAQATRLMTMWRRAVQPQTRENVAPLACCVCHSAAKMDHDDDDHKDGDDSSDLDVLACCNCMWAFHQTCMAQTYAKIEAAGLLPVATEFPPALPDHFAGRLCVFCLAAWST